MIKSTSNILNEIKHL